MPCWRKTGSAVWKTLLTFYFLAISCYILIVVQNNRTRILSQSDTVPENVPENIPQNVPQIVPQNDTVPSVTWITMGLCWSGNAQILGKNEFPYKEAVPLSIQLWNKFTPAKVIVQIIYSDQVVSPELEDYRDSLEKLGATVFLVPTGEDITCVQKSQLIRLLAHYFPFIHDNDIIVTADVDAFVMTEDLYKPLTLDRKIYLYRYANTLDSGFTFMMPFIGIKASLWRKMFQNYDVSKDHPEKGLVGKGLPKMIEYYNKTLNFDSSWYVDQDIFSYEILSTGLCSLPTNHVLWEKLKIDPNLPREFDDRKTCWHGPATFEDCNNASFERNMKLRYYGGNCKWWHFTPNERYPALKSKFDEIMSGRSENPLVNYLMKAAKSFHQ